MNIFRFFLIVVFAGVFVYTLIVGQQYGWDLLSIFFGDIAKMNWPGQFNLDFMCHLILAGLWISWRHHFSPKGLFLGILALFGGILLLTTYLFVISLESKGDLKEFFLGRKRANR